MLFGTASHVPLALLATTLLSATSSQAATLERLSAVTPHNVSVSYDRTYDSTLTTSDDVSCSDWMTTKDYLTLSELPSFPRVAGADVIDGSHSALCGQCWQLTYHTPTETNVHVVVIDTATKGFTISEHAMNDLTDGKAAGLGRVDAEAKVVAREHCGMQ
ncbi:hypothetical protein V8D89_003750 [Ganoderma adspersum]